MASRFAWIDVDEASRRTMLDFIDQFRDQGTLDEIGIGTIRDAFADYFFPGTTTVQTRARYFLFVPWIYRRLESKGTSSAELTLTTGEQIPPASESDTSHATQAGRDLRLRAHRRRKR